MRFGSDAQRRAVFASINGSNSFSTMSYPANSVLSTEPEYVYDGKIVNQFSNDETPLDPSIATLRKALEERKKMKNLDPKKTKVIEDSLTRLEYERLDSKGETYPDQDLDDPAMASAMRHLDDSVYEKFAAEWNAAKTKSDKDEIERRYNEGEFSKGRAPKKGEIVYFPPEPDAGIPNAEGRVVEVYDNSADIEFGFGKDAVVVEHGFEEFEDQQSLKDRQKEDEEAFNVKEADENLEAGASMYDRLIHEYNMAQRKK